MHQLMPLWQIFTHRFLCGHMFLFLLSICLSGISWSNMITLCLIFEELPILSLYHQYVMVLISAETALTVSNIRYSLSFCYRHLRDMRWHLIAVLVGIFLMASEAARLSVCLVGVCRSCLEECLSCLPSARFNRFVTSLLTLRNLCVIQTDIPHQTRNLWVFSPILWHYHLLDVGLWSIEVLNFDETKLIYFYFASCTFGVVSRSHCLSPGHGFTAYFLLRVLQF